MKTHIALAIIAALMLTVHTFAGEDAFKDDLIKAELTEPEGCTTDSECGCTDDCLEPAEDTDPEDYEVARADDNFYLTGGE